jgi:predicted lipoprotein with Yx(FWY)xxD motif
MEESRMVMRIMKKLLVLGAAGALLALVVVSTAVAYPNRPDRSWGGEGSGGQGGSGSRGGHGHGHRPAGEGAVVSIEQGPYGPVLVVGGAGAGYVPAEGSTPAHYIVPAGTSLYFPTVDPSTFEPPFGHPYQAGCTTAVVEGTAEGTLSCTGSETDTTADWPAFTTEGRPVAGPGVEPWLLGSVYRADLGTYQVTYAGHPLYLFDPGPNSFFGANFFESALPLPPWHTAWYLLSPEGLPATGPANLEVEVPQPGTSYTAPALATEMLPNVVPGGAAITVYSFSGDNRWRSRCNWACEREFIPVTTVGTPTAQEGVSSSSVGVIRRQDGSLQVTYNGHPLYIYSQEQPLVGEMGLVTTGSAGNGNGIEAYGGTFSVVNP